MQNFPKVQLNLLQQTKLNQIYFEKSALAEFFPSNTNQRFKTTYIFRLGTYTVNKEFFLKIISRENFKELVRLTLRRSIG